MFSFTCRPWTSRASCALLVLSVLVLVGVARSATAHSTAARKRTKQPRISSHVARSGRLPSLHTGGRRTAGAVSSRSPSCLVSSAMKPRSAIRRSRCGATNMSRTASTTSGSGWTFASHSTRMGSRRRPSSGSLRSLAPEEEGSNLAERAMSHVRALKDRSGRRESGRSNQPSQGPDRSPATRHSSIQPGTSMGGST